MGWIYLAIITSIFALLSLPNIEQSYASEHIRNTEDKILDDCPAEQTRIGYMDEKFVEIEQKLPGFSGVFIDEQGRLNAYFTNPEEIDKSEAEQVLSSELERDISNGIVILETKYAWHELLCWKLTLRELLEQKELGITSLDADEKKQKVVVGFEKLDDSRKEQVTEFLSKKSIPLDAVEFEQTGLIVLESSPVTTMEQEQEEEQSSQLVPIAVISAITVGAVGIVVWRKKRS